jgi:hypothetical protein
MGDVKCDRDVLELRRLTHMKDTGAQGTTRTGDASKLSSSGINIGAITNQGGH